MNTPDTGMLSLKDERYKYGGNLIEFKGVGDYLQIQAMAFYELVDLDLDEGQVNELYEFLGRWIDVQGQT